MDSIISFAQEEYDNGILTALAENIKKDISNILDSSGIMYRIFARSKSRESIIDKISRKKQQYNEKKDYLLQDSIGIRIVLYFRDDVDICINILEELFHENNHEVDRPDPSTFKPERINYVFDIPETYNFPIGYKEKGGIDNTFEIQIRTVFSEGWHEVEHDIRYKHRDDWDGEYAMDRDMNALFAVLEMCDNNIVGICDNLSYNKYKKRDIEAMIRNRFRIRLDNAHISDELKGIIYNDYDNIAKSIFRFDRHKLISILGKTSIERKMDNIIFIINYFKIHNEKITLKCSSEITTKLAGIVGNNDTGMRIENYRSIVAMRY